MASTESQSLGRIAAFDAQRGLIMLIMAIDHASMFIAGVHHSEFWGLPLPDYGSALGLFTRVVSHLCAPGFFLFMGVGMALFANSRRRRGMGEGELVRHFALRGAILIVLDAFVITPAWLLDSLDAPIDAASAAVGVVPGGGGMLLYAMGVLTALGAAMAIGGVALRLGARTNAALGLAIILACQVLIPEASRVAEPLPLLARVLLVAGHDGFVLAIYPIAPWLGVCLLGIAFGSAVQTNLTVGLRRALPVGVVALLLFVGVRGLGGFGTYHPLPSDDWMAWFMLTKYPPSLAFLLLSLGVNALLLWLLSREPASQSRFARILLVFGRAPLFFYVAHLYVYALIGLALPEDISLVWMYPVWLVGLALLYPACSRYTRFKRAKSEDSLWRLF